MQTDLEAAMTSVDGSRVRMLEGGHEKLLLFVTLFINNCLLLTIMPANLRYWFSEDTHYDAKRHVASASQDPEVARRVDPSFRVQVVFPGLIKVGPIAPFRCARADSRVRVHRDWMQTPMRYA